MKISAIFLIFLILYALSTIHARKFPDNTKVSEKKLADDHTSDGDDSSEDENGSVAFDGNRGRRSGFGASVGLGGGGGFGGGIDVDIGRGLGIDARFGGGAGGGQDGSLGFGGGLGGDADSLGGGFGSESP